MATTTYKGYELQVTGTNPNTWGATNNTDVINRIDQNLGGIVTKSVVDGGTVTLTTDESRQAILRITGAVNTTAGIVTSCQGFFFLENLTTGSGTCVVIYGILQLVVPRGLSTIIVDATNGPRVASTATFPPGTYLPFYNATAPTGWTRNTNPAFNHAIRITGTGSTGSGFDNNTTGFTSIFAARTITRANLPNDTITTTTNGAHTHTYSATSSSGAIPSSGTSFNPNGQILTTSSNGDHTHTIALNGGVTQTPLDMNVSYVNMMLAVKD